MFRRLLQTTRRNSFCLFGARGTGKTTYIRNAFNPDAVLYIDLLDAEIDLLIDRPGTATVLIEIKSSTRVDDRVVRNLARFTGDFADPLALCVSQDPARLTINGVLCVHWRETIEELGLT